MAGEIKKVLFSEGLTVDAPSSSPFDVGDYADFDEVAAPATPDAGIIRVYAKTDGNLYKKDSAGVESQVGSGAGGSGEKNYIENPSGTDDAAAAVPTGWANVGDLDIVVTKTAADLPREYTTGAGLKITADANTQSVSDYVYYDFSLDDVDLSKKLKIQWSQKTTGTYAAGDLAVVITSQADRTTALHTPITTAIPAADGVFTTSFDTTTTAALSLVIRATTDMATNGGIVISDVIVGPGVVQSVPPVEEWQSWTPTGAWSSNTTYTGKWRRVGDSMELQGLLALAGAPTSADLYVNMPTGYTVDTSKLTAGSGGDYPTIGHAEIFDSGARRYVGAVVYGSDSTFYILHNESGNNGLVNATSPVTFANNDKISFKATVPIAKWAGGAVTLAQNDVEYSSNTGGEGTTAGATYSNSAYYTYGPAGSQFVSVDSATGSSVTAYYVKWQRSVQAGDQLTFEYTTDGGTTWSPNSYSFPTTIISQGTSQYGVCVYHVDSTTSKVIFGNMGRQPNNATYAGAGSTWAGIAGNANYKWRVRKSSGGQAVGHGLADTTSSGLAPFGVFRAGEQGNLALQEKSATPSDPTSSAEAKIYLKSDKLVIQFNDAGTVRYKYLDLTGTGVTWVHTTSAP